jgi:TM2 domain-containing membrane protein YozV
MVQCSNCRNELAPDARFCDKCGRPVDQQQQQYQQYQQQPQYGPPPPQYQPYPYYVKEKEAALAIVLSLLIPGVGQIYCGRILRGILILVLIPGFSMVLSLALYGMVMYNGTGSGFMFNFPIVFIIIFLIGIILWIWQIVDAYRLANRYNEELRRTGRAPW